MKLSPVASAPSPSYPARGTTHGLRRLAVALAATAALGLAACGGGGGDASGEVGGGEGVRLPGESPAPIADMGKPDKPDGFWPVAWFFEWIDPDKPRNVVRPEEPVRLSGAVARPHL